ncbi:MAG: hypothetical protein WCD80_02505 [Desulfobaccales bacterium]
MIVALAATVHPVLPAEPAVRSINDLVKILDIQIPGWQREGDPKVVPVMQKENIMVTLIIDIFRSDMQVIKIYLVIPAKQTVAETMARVAKEDAKPVQVKGFAAIKVAPPITPYEKYDSSLSINVADRFVVTILGEEVLNPDTLLKVADLIDLKKLAAMPQDLTKK